MPTTFSTALPAIATITSPANSSLMCSVWIAGVSAVTNQSDVNAAAAPATREDRPPSPASTSARARAPRRACCAGTTAASARRAPAARPRRSARAPRSALRPARGTRARATGSPSSRRRARRASRRCARARSRSAACRCLSPPTTNAIPSTSTLFARIEPTSAAWTTFDEPVVQREERDEELGQVAERRLDDARRRRSRAARRAARSPCRRGARARPARRRRRRTSTTSFSAGEMAEPPRATTATAVIAISMRSRLVTARGTYQPGPRRTSPIGGGGPCRLMPITGLSGSSSQEGLLVAARLCSFSRSCSARPSSPRPRARPS